MNSPQWLDETEAEAWRGYLRLNAVLMATLHRELQRDSGLSVSDYDVLVILSEAPPPRRMRMHELGAQLLWEKSRLSHHITRMERRGLVRREDCEADARGAFVSITPKGLQTIEDAAPAHVANVRRHVFNHLSRMDVETLAKMTKTLLHQLASTEAGVSA